MAFSHSDSNRIIMPINEERLRQTFSEGGAQEIYQGIKACGDFLGCEVGTLAEFQNAGVESSSDNTRGLKR